MNAERRAITRWEGMIEHLMHDQGYADDEIIAAFDLMSRRSPGGRGMQMRSESRELLHWDNLHDRRRIEALILAARGREPVTDLDRDLIAAAFDRWTAREGNHDRLMPQDEMIAESGIGRDRISAALRRHGVMDFRRLRSVLKLRPQTGPQHGT